MATAPMFQMPQQQPFAYNPNPRSKAEHYWNGVHAEANRIAALFPTLDTFFVTSVEDPLNGMKGGVTFPVDLRHAAIRIAERTHRLATQEEVEAYMERDRKEVERLNQINEQKKQQSILKPSAEQMESQAALIAHVVKALLEENRAALREDAAGKSAPTSVADEKTAPKTK